MPKSKRNKVVSLSKTTKKGFELKKELVKEVQRCCDEFSSLYVFSTENMRNQKIKGVRQQWRSSRFFFGKNKVMSLALGRTIENEYKENLHQISNRLVGDVGLFFTNESKESVLKWFKNFSVNDYARAGISASQTVTLHEGALDENTFQHTMEPNLRKLGLPTELRKGIIHLTTDFVICKEGDILSPEQCTILKCFSYPLVNFRINLNCVWHSANGLFEEL